MLIAPPKSTIPPLAVTGFLFSNWASSALFAAVDLDLFGAIKEGAKTASDIAQKLRLNEKGVSVMLDALVGLNLLEKQNNTYNLIDAADLYLVKSSPLYLGDYLRFAHENTLETWNSLADAMRTGKPRQEVNQDETAQQFFPSLAQALFPLNYTTASMVAEHLELESLPDHACVLDVAAGSAVWSIPMAQRKSTLTVHTLDFPAVLEVAKKFTKKCGVDHQFKYLTGNWRDVNLQPDTYDIIILGHILHSEGRLASEKLLNKVYTAMKMGGRLIVAEFIANDLRTGPLPPLLFAINMYLQTSDGCVFTLSELSKLLESQGFAQISRLDLPFFKGESPVVVAVKK